MKNKVPGLVVAVLLMCAGCAVEEPLDIPTPSEPSVSPAAPSSQVSYDVAEDQARNLLERYLRLTDTITSESGEKPERIREVVSDEWWLTELADFEAYRSKGERTVGETTFDSFVLQVARVTVDDTVDLSVFACVDSAGVFVLGPGVSDPPAEVLALHPHYDEFSGTDEERAIIDSYFLDNEVRFGQRQPVVFWLTGSDVESLVIDSQEQWWGEHPC